MGLAQNVEPVQRVLVIELNHDYDVRATLNGADDLDMSDGVEGVRADEGEEEFMNKIVFKTILGKPGQDENDINQPGQVLAIVTIWYSANRISMKTNFILPERFEPDEVALMQANTKRPHRLTFLVDLGTVMI